MSSKNDEVSRELDTGNSIKSDKIADNLVVRINQDSDDNFQALFDSVLNPSETKRPIQVPLRMRKLPNSFFNPPAAYVRPVVSHSRANSADSVIENGSLPNVSQPLAANSMETHTNAAKILQEPPANKLIISHSRAHSSPASLQQSYTMQPSDRSLTGKGNNAEQNFLNFTSNATATIGLNSIPTHHMKQRSYDVVSPIQLQNDLGPLPPGWEQAKTNDGQIYYLNI